MDNINLTEQARAIAAQRGYGQDPFGSYMANLGRIGGQAAFVGNPKDPFLSESIVSSIIASSTQSRLNTQYGGSGFPAHAALQASRFDPGRSMLGHLAYGMFGSRVADMPFLGSMAPGVIGSSIFQGNPFTRTFANADAMRQAGWQAYAAGNMLTPEALGLPYTRPSDIAGIAGFLSSTGGMRGNVQSTMRGDISSLSAIRSIVGNVPAAEGMQQLAAWTGGSSIRMSAAQRSSLTGQLAVNSYMSGMAPGMYAESLNIAAQDAIARGRSPLAEVMATSTASVYGGLMQAIGAGSAGENTRYIQQRLSQGYASQTAQMVGGAMNAILETGRARGMDVSSMQPSAVAASLGHSQLSSFFGAMEQGTYNGQVTRDQVSGLLTQAGIPMHQAMSFMQGGKSASTTFARFVSPQQLMTLQENDQFFQARRKAYMQASISSIAPGLSEKQREKASGILMSAFSGGMDLNDPKAMARGRSNTIRKLMRSGISKDVAEQMFDSAYRSDVQVFGGPEKYAQYQGARVVQTLLSKASPEQRATFDAYREFAIGAGLSPDWTTMAKSLIQGKSIGDIVKTHLFGMADDETVGKVKAYTDLISKGPEGSGMSRAEFAKERDKQLQGIRQHGISVGTQRSWTSSINYYVGLAMGAIEQISQGTSTTEKQSAG